LIFQKRKLSLVRTIVWFHSTKCVVMLYWKDKGKLFLAIAAGLTFLTWIGCCVAFGGPLHKVGSQVFFQNHYSLNGDSIKYTDSGCYNCNVCKGGGGGLVAMAVFAFLITMALMALAALRVIGKELMVPGVSSTTMRYSDVMLAVSNATVFLVFLMICIWGGTCYKYGLDNKGENSVVPLGFAWICLTLFIQIGATVLFFLHRKEANVVSSQTGSNPGLLEGQTY